jgi:hypothetical protein
MRKYLTSIAWTACGAACSTAFAHPGHGDTAHFFLGGPHEAQDAHQWLSHPLAAVALLLASVLVLTVSVARARSQGLPRPRRNGSDG